MSASLQLSLMSQVCHCCQNLSSELFVMESTPLNEDDLTPHTSEFHISHLTFQPSQPPSYHIQNCLLTWELLLSSQCSDQMRLRWWERAYPWWLTDADYWLGSTSYQSQGGVWEKFSPTTVSLTTISHQQYNWLNNITQSLHRNIFININGSQSNWVFLRLLLINRAIGDAWYRYLV